MMWGKGVEGLLIAGLVGVIAVRLPTEYAQSLRQHCMEAIPPPDSNVMASAVGTYTSSWLGYINLYAHALFHSVHSNVNKHDPLNR